MEFACSPHVCVGSLWVLQHPPTVQKQACLVNLALGVSVCVCVCTCMVVYPVCVCVALRWTGDLSGLYPASCPMTTGDRHRLPRDPAWKQRIDGCDRPTQWTGTSQ
ncbi:hypothetical protein XENORESO_002119 [Xenotaenia resolanae]|uniref:Uncharacterized protein n=1 Tax=Xenotaenia resolanae TaxID=208358 RepID=A0ABV0WP00_9TELE